VRLVLADGVVGQVLADAVDQVGTGPRRLCFLRVGEPGGHRRSFLRVREFAALGELRGHPRQVRLCAIWACACLLRLAVSTYVCAGCVAPDGPRQIAQRP
jgi:hypothetical protein